MNKSRERSRESYEAEIAGLKTMIESLEDALEKAREEAHREVHRGGDERFLDFASFVVANLSDGAYLIGKDSLIVYVNEAACRPLGYTQEEMIGMSIMQIDPRVNQELWEMLWEVTARDKKQTIETEHITKSGERIPVEILANYLAFDGKEYSCAFSRDIRDRKRMESRIRQSEKMEAIGQLAGGIAHDFNNQLAGIVGYTDLLIDELGDNRDLLRLAEGVLTAAKRSSALTAQLLAFSRQGKYLSIPVDMSRIVEEVVLMLRRSIDKRIRIRTEFSAISPITLGDPSQLQNAVLNLALNARDAMPSGGELAFSTSLVDLDEAFCTKSPFIIMPGAYVQVVVADTGCGIEPALQERMFEPFFTTKEKGRGTGMGLAAVYGTVKNHRGAIHVYSEVGRGTEMKLYLPLSLDRKKIEESLRPPPPVSLNARVLVVDDEDFVRDMAAKMLQKLGCEVLTAANGREAVSVYRESAAPIDLVLLDLVMPEMGGRETFLALQKIHPEVRAVIASGYSLDGEVQGILDRGAAGFVQKPFRYGELANVLADALSKTGP